jgi:hypothetical protein
MCVSPSHISLLKFRRPDNVETGTGCVGTNICGLTATKLSAQGQIFLWRVPTHSDARNNSTGSRITVLIHPECSFGNRQLSSRSDTDVTSLGPRDTATYSCATSDGANRDEQHRCERRTTPCTGRGGGGVDQSIAKPLPTQESTAQHRKTDIHPCLERDSNPRSQYSSCPNHTRLKLQRHAWVRRN